MWDKSMEAKRGGGSKQQETMFANTMTKPNTLHASLKHIYVLKDNTGFMAKVICDRPISQLSRFSFPTNHDHN